MGKKINSFCSRILAVVILSRRFAIYEITCEFARMHFCRSCVVIKHADNHLTAEERQAIQQQLAKSLGRFSDRQCRLTVISKKGKIDDLAKALCRCLLTEEETIW
ncbi:MAG: hypothetical protein ACSLEM_04655 [Candidatus Malihini olakiniferum]